MVNFFERLGFGRKSVEPVPEPQKTFREAPVRRAEDPEILRVRDANFARAVSDFLHRSPTSAELETARAMVTGGDARDPLPQLSKEEMAGKVTHIARQLGWTSEALEVDPNLYVPMQEPYARMGERRQKAFEVALQEALGGDMTKTDIKIARAMFETDPDISKQWEQMAAEDVAIYARSIARRMTAHERAALASK